MANNDQLKQLLNMGLSALGGGNAQNEGAISELIEHLTGGIDIPQQLLGTVEKLLGGNDQPAVQPEKPAAAGSMLDTLTQLSQLVGHTEEAAAQKAGEAHNSILSALNGLPSAAGKAEDEMQQHTQQAHDTIMNALGSLTSGAQEVEQDAHGSVMNALGALDKDQLGSVLGKVTDLLGSLGK